jgi:hypothetical protein
MRQAEGEAAKYQAVSLGLDYVPFGTGRHAWLVVSLHGLCRKNNLNCIIFAALVGTLLSAK